MWTAHTQIKFMAISVRVFCTFNTGRQRVKSTKNSTYFTQCLYNICRNYILYLLSILTTKVVENTGHFNRQSYRYGWSFSKTTWVIALKYSITKKFPVPCVKKREFLENTDHFYRDDDNDASLFKKSALFLPE